MLHHVTVESVVCKQTFGRLTVCQEQYMCTRERKDWNSSPHQTINCMWHYKYESMSGKELPKPAAQIKLQRVYDTIVTNVRECQQRFIDNNILNENTQGMW